MDFHIDGDAGGIRSRASTMRTKGESFSTVGTSLSKITTGNWIGRAADHFKDDFDVEPKRWNEAGAGFATAAGALEAYADALDNAKKRAAWSSREYRRGQDVTTDAQHAYDADVSRAKAEVSAAQAQGNTMTLTIIPFRDPGKKICDGAVAEYESAKHDLEIAAHEAAQGVRNGCSAAPHKRKWYESGLAAIGGFLAGAGEAVWDLGKLAVYLNPMTGPLLLLSDAAMDIGSGHLTPEELAEKYKLKVEDVEGMLKALKDDPAGFGKNLGKAVLDWDTWSDDPARALGHLVPDAVIAVLTLGSGTAATAGVKGAEGAEALSGLSKLDDLGELSKLDDVGDLSKLDDLSHVDLDKLPDWHEPAHGIDPEAEGLVKDGFDPYQGLDRQDYYDRHWDPDEGSWRYPENDGFADTPEANHIPEGAVLDRFGRPTGRFASPEGTPYEQRGLPSTSLTDDYYKYKVERPLPERVTEGPISPAFEMPGGGTQYFFDKPIQWYVEHGYLKQIYPEVP